MIREIHHFSIQFTNGDFSTFVNPRIIKKNNKILIQDRNFPDCYVELVPEIDYDNNNK